MHDTHHEHSPRLYCILSSLTIPSVHARAVFMPCSLLTPLQERLELQHQAEAEFAAERALVDEVVARIQQEDRMELAARRAKQADTKVCRQQEQATWPLLIAAVTHIINNEDILQSLCPVSTWCPGGLSHTMWIAFCCLTQAYIEAFLCQREEDKAAALAAARAEDQKIQQYWSMVGLRYRLGSQ